MALLLSPLLTHAQASTFQNRVEAGYKASESKSGRQYENQIAMFISKTMRGCVPVDTQLLKDKDNFTLVSWIKNTGLLIDSQVKPHNPISTCFLHAFSKVKLPTPPISGSNKNGYPLTIYMKLAP